MKLTHYRTEKKDTISIIFKIEELENLPLKIIMKTLEIIEENNKLLNYYCVFDEYTQKFIDKNQKMYDSICKKESENFKRLSSLYFNDLYSPLFLSADKVLDKVSKIYEIEKFVPNKLSTNVPKVIYALQNEKNSTEKKLSVKNLDSLIEKFGKGVTLHSLILFKDHLNHENEILNKTDVQPYLISSEILKATFDTNINKHVLLDNFSSKDYFFQAAFNEQCKKINRPEEIFELVLLQEELRKKLLPIIYDTKKFKVGGYY